MLSKHRTPRFNVNGSAVRQKHGAISLGYLAAAGARNFNIRRGSSELAITESRGGINPPRWRAVDGRQHMLSLSLIKFL